MRSSKSRSRSKQNRPRTLGNIINRVFDSSGPEGKVRGTPAQLIEKYQFLARDAQLSNDRVAAENFLQHAEHYTRLLAEAQREMAAEQEARQQNHGQGGNGNGNGQGGNGRRDEYRPDYRQDFREGDEQPEISGHDVIDVIGDEDVGLVATPEARPADQQRGDRNQGQRGDRDQGQRRDQDGNRGGNSNQRRSYPPRIDQGRPDQPRQDQGRQEQGRQEQGRQDQPRDGNRDQARGEQPRRDPRPPRSPEKVGEKGGEKPVERAAEQPASLQVIEVQQASQPVVLAPPGAPVESPTPAPEQPALFSEAEAAPAKKPRSPSTRTRAPKKAAEAKTEAPTEGSSEA